MNLNNRKAISHNLVVTAYLVSNYNPAIWFNPTYETKIKCKLLPRDKDNRTGFKNTNSNNLTFAHYKNGHSDKFFFSIQSISQVLLFLQWFPPFLVLSSYNQKHHPCVRGLFFSLPCIWKILSGLSLKRWQ